MDIATTRGELIEGLKGLLTRFVTVSRQRSTAEPIHPMEFSYICGWVNLYLSKSSLAELHRILKEKGVHSGQERIFLARDKSVSVDDLIEIIDEVTKDELDEIL